MWWSFWIGTYRSKDAVRLVVQRFSKLGVHAHVWRRKGLENNLLVPETIVRLSGADLTWTHETVARIAEALKAKVFSRMQASELRRGERRKSGVHIVSVTDTFQKEFESLWEATDRVAMCPAKKVLRALNVALQENGLRTVSAWSLSKQLKPVEIDPEVGGLLDRVEELAASPTRVGELRTPRTPGYTWA